jgi:hypothetical protein
MKKMIEIIAAVFVIAGMTGCASSSRYFADRGRDTADIFTATAGVGLGAKARIGPLGVGMILAGEFTGLKGGTLLHLDKKDECFEMYPVLNPCPASAGGSLGGFGGETYDLRATNSMPRIRGKCYRALSSTPLVVLPLGETTMNGPSILRGFHPFYTQIEVSAACVVGIKLGFNPGELLDFTLGWTTIDIFNDDLQSGQLKAESNKSAEVTPKPDVPQ